MSTGSGLQPPGHITLLSDQAARGWGHRQLAGGHLCQRLAWCWHTVGAQYMFPPCLVCLLPSPESQPSEHTALSPPPGHLLIYPQPCPSLGHSQQELWTLPGQTLSQPVGAHTPLSFHHLPTEMISTLCHPRSPRQPQRGESDRGQGRQTAYPSRPPPPFLMR